MFASKCVFAFVAVVLAFFSNIADGCTCPPIELKDRLCDAHFVMMARIKDVDLTKEKMLNGERVYKVAMQYMYLQSNEFNKSANAMSNIYHVTVPTSGAACGFKLGMKDEMVVLSGRATDEVGMLTANGCEYSEKFRDLKASDKKFLFELKCKQQGGNF